MTTQRDVLFYLYMYGQDNKQRNFEKTTISPFSLSFHSHRRMGVTALGGLPSDYILSLFLWDFTGRQLYNIVKAISEIS